MKRVWKNLFITLLVSVMTCGSVWAQATAQISGTVQDTSGAVLPGVEVTATQTDTGVSRMTVSNETGSYVLPNLPLGPYRLEAGLPGFRTFVQTGIVLQVGANPTLNITLQVGQVSEQVEVQANAGLVETRSLSVGQVMETARIMELPLNGRNAQELILLSGAASEAAPVGGYTVTGRLTISTAGSLGTSMDYTLDGIRHVDPYDTLGLPLPFPDALAEFKTDIGGQSASQGRGSSVSAVTKSGTNDFHGDLFEFVRNDLLNATTYFAALDSNGNKKESTLKRNQYGGTLGGPIQKNKLFFFGGFQGTKVRRDPNDVQAYVPTAAMLAGDFTTFASAACNARGAVTLRAPFVNNRIDPALFSPVAKNLAARLPKTNDPCGLITYGQRQVEDQKMFVGKVDYQQTDKHSLFGRALLLYADYRYPLDPSNPLTASESRFDKAYMYTIGSTYLLSSNTVNSFRVGYSKTRQDQGPPLLFDMGELGSKVTIYMPKLIQITVNSGFELGGNPRRIRSNLYQMSDDVSMTRGTHQFSFGGRVAQSRTIGETGDTILPNFTVSGDVTGTGLSDLMVGKVQTFVQGLGSGNYLRMKYVSLYGQDTWKLKPRLTASYGVRWAPVYPLEDYRRPVPNVSNFYIDRYRQGLRSKTFVNAPPGFVYSGDPELVQYNNGNDPAKPRADLWNTYWKNFAPRLGFAWDVQGDGKTSVRASYGLNFEEYGSHYRIGTAQQQPPWGSTTRLVTPPGGLDDPWAGIPGGNPHPLQLNPNMPFVPRGDYLPTNPDLTPTYTQTWNLSVQREVSKDTLLSLSYLGTQIVHIQSPLALNPAIYVPGNGDANGNCFLNGRPTYYRVNPGAACSTTGNTQDRRTLSFENPAFREEIGRLAVVVNGGTQNYHGMLLQVQHRGSHGINLNGNYTLSHCIGDYMGRANSGYGSSVDHTYQDQNDRHRDRANCEIDARHIFNFTGVVETPQFANRTLNLLGSGWRLSGLYKVNTGAVNAANASSGVRTVTLGAASAAQRSSVGGGDVCLCDISNQRPNLLLPDAIYLDTSGRPNTQYLNPAAFGQPTVGTLGNMGRVNIRLPLAWQFDMALARTFRLREAQTIEFRAEAYNVLNSFRAGVINTALSSAQFGRIRTALDPRIMQFALKYLF
jgi:carboxypeptidase family protein